MLVLTRKPQQSICFKGTGLIFLKLLRVDLNGCVRLGFEASNKVKILREELLTQKLLSKFKNDFNLKGDDQNTTELIDYQSYRSGGDLYR